MFVMAFRFSAFQHFTQPLIHFAIPKAAAAAKPPISIVCNPLLQALIPVKLPFTNPNTNSAISVTITEIESACSFELATMYGNSGTSPPTT